MLRVFKSRKEARRLSQQGNTKGDEFREGQWGRLFQKLGLLLLLF